MNTTQAKNLNLPALLAQLGHHPVKTTNQGQELWYHSPFRNDKTPSFHTSYRNGKWIWNDFGGTGGTVIDFALQHLATSDVSQALAFLAELTGRVGEGGETSDVSPLHGTSEQTTNRPRRSRAAIGAGGEGNLSTLELISATPISNPQILNYLTQTRRIPEPLIRRHLTEVTYRNAITHKEFFAFGLQNRAGGYEIRSASDDHPFKSVIGPRDISLLPGSNPTSGIVSLFEGTLDFLSLLAIMHPDQLGGDAIVMHSLSSYQKTVAALRSGNYQTINLFLDNDQSGVDVAFRFQRDLSGVVDRASLFHPHKDLNAFWLSSAAKATAPGEKPKEVPFTTLEEARAREGQLVQKLEELTDAACRTVFSQNKGAKADAFEQAMHRSGSGYRADLSIAKNMNNPTFRATFKLIVQERFPEQFAGVTDLKKEVSKVRIAISRLKQ